MIHADRRTRNLAWLPPRRQRPRFDVPLEGFELLLELLEPSIEPAFGVIQIAQTESGFEGLMYHELRHTQATLLLGNGVDVKTVQTRLGHADAGITLNWYAHAMPDNDEQAANLLAAVMEHPEKAAKTA